MTGYDELGALMKIDGLTCSCCTSSGGRQMIDLFKPRHENHYVVKLVGTCYQGVYPSHASYQGLPSGIGSQLDCKNSDK